MNRSLAALKTCLSRSDALLFGVAALGLLLYVLLLPGQHPHSAATYALGEEGAQEAASAFLTRQGYPTDSLDAEAEFQANDELLDSLQASLGRPGTLRFLRGGQREEVPAFYWRVTYRGADDADQDDGDRNGRDHRYDRDDRYEVKVTAEGTVWSFENEERGNPGRPPYVDRAALRSAIAAMQAGTTEPQADVGGLPDSALVERLVFQLGEAADSSVDAGARAAAERFLPEEPILLNAAAAEALAFYHLAQTSLPAAHFRADSAWTRSESRQGRNAYVRLVTSEPIHGQHAQADVEVTSTGALQEMEVEFNPHENEDPPIHLAGQIATGVMVAVLILILLVAFFRRLARRLIDVKAALIDAGVLGVLFIAFLALNKDIQMGGEDIPFWAQVAFWVFGFGIAGGGVALFTFLVSAATDSLTRAVLPSKLRSASLVRQASLRNTFVGLALVRGVALALVLLGFTVVLLLALPGAGVHEGALVLNQTFWPVGYTAVLMGCFIYFTTVLMLLGVGTFFYRLQKRAWVLVVAVAVGVSLIQGSVVQLRPMEYNWVASALVGGVLGLAFWRYDFLTCFVGLFLAELVWGLNEGWLVESSPVGLDLILATLFVASVAVLGFVGVASGRSGLEVKEYVPSYIEEMAQQERMEHELKLAQQVQMSFLPRKMPRVKGLDVAAMCLPALEVGGDYYDFVEVAPGKLAVAVGDVSGKGIQAAFYMTLAKGFVQTLSRDGGAPADVLRRLNTLFCENVPRGTFISMIYGVVDVEARTFTFARAGHNPVILKRSPSRQPEIFQPAGMAIGLAPGPRFNNTIEEATIDLLPGDALVFYTDGFSEAMNRVKEQYGDDRLAQKVGDIGRRPASGILQLVSEDVHHFVQEAGRHDDMTMVVIKLDGPPTPAATDNLPTEHAEPAAVTA